MRTRTILISLAAVVTISAIGVVAGSLRWSEVPVIYQWMDDGTRDQPMLLEIQLWADGSGEFKLTPKIELPADKLPSVGEITVNGKVFDMAQRRDAEGRLCLFGSVPVGTFSLYEDMVYTLKAYDSHGVQLSNDYASRYLVP